jgi:enoyl-CoA hydratase/carnithine racemase
VGYQHIELSIDGAIAELKLARPEVRNAMSPEMGDEIVHAVSELNASDGLRAVIVTGEGKSFSAGGDLAMLEARTRNDGEHNRRGMRAFYGKYLAIREVHVPTIAAMHGHAIGAGLCFALGCDIRVAQNGTKMGATFVKVGLHPGMGASFLLPRIVGAARAAELLLTGRVILADEAARIGLISDVCDDVRQRARAIADEIAAAAPVAVAQLKATLRDDGNRSLGEALDREAACQAINYATTDMAEACKAFGEKRKPSFIGR